MEEIRPWRGGVGMLLLLLVLGELSWGIVPWRGALVIKEDGGYVEWCRGSARLEMEAAGRWIRLS